MYGCSRLCDRLRSSAIIWKQLSLRSSAICDLRSAIVCDHMETSLNECPILSHFGCFSGHVLSKTKSVTPHFFYISDITNSLSYSGKSFRKKSMLKIFRANVLKSCRKGRFTRYDFFACDNGLRQAHDMIYDCCVRLQKCRSILKHILKRCDNRKVML